MAIEKVEGQQQYLVKWQTLGYEDATWCTHKELEKLPRFCELVTKRKTITKSTWVCVYTLLCFPMTDVGCLQQLFGPRSESLCR